MLLKGHSHKFLKYENIKNIECFEVVWRAIKLEI